MVGLGEMLDKKMAECPTLPDGDIKKRYLMEASLYADTVAASIEEAKEIFRSKTRFFEPEEYSWASRIVMRALDLISELYYPIRFQSETMLTGIRSTFKQIASFVDNPSRNPFHSDKLSGMLLWQMCFLFLWFWA